MKYLNLLCRIFLLSALTFFFFSISNAAGNVSVTATTGTGGPYATLYAAFAAINAGTFTGSIVININGNTTESAGNPVLNASGVGSASYTSVLIQPTVAATITGSVTGGAIIKLDGSSNVTINGAIGAGTTPSLTVTNTYSTTVTNNAVIWVGSSSTHAAKNVTIENCIIKGNAPTTTFIGVLSGGDGSISTYDPQTTANNNLTIQNNEISNVQWGIDAYGPTAGPDSGLVITGNQITSLGQLGAYISNQYNLQINNNTISNILYTADHGTMAGINVASTLTGSSTSISGNQISHVKSTGLQSAAVGVLISGSWPAGGAVNGNSIDTIEADSANASGIEIFPTVTAIAGGTFNGNNINTITSKATSNLTYVTAGASGIFLAVGNSYTQRTKLTVSNNFISNVTGYGYGTIASGNMKYNGTGIMVYSGGGYNIYYNSINLSANQIVAGQSAALYVADNGPVPDSLNVADNLFVNTESTGTTYGIYSEVTKSAFLNIDYNDYYAATGLGYIGTTTETTIAGMQTGFGGNTHSGAILPSFVSPINLHLNDYNNFCLASGVSISGITTDIDTNTRIAPDMGADEFTFSFDSVTTPGGCPGSSATITVNDATGTLATGTYKITYSLSAPNASTGDTATIAYVGGSTNQGVFTIPAALLSTNGSTTVTINTISSTVACSADLNPVPVTVTSSPANQVTFVVGSGSVVPAVAISTPQLNVCSGTYVTFTAVPTNGGTTPTYQWKKNGTDVGTNSSTYIDSSVANNEVITCVMTSSSSCASPATATSNSITITLSGSVTPSVQITTLQDTICGAGSASFTAVPTNGGSTPTYQWKKNGTNVGANAATYTDNTPVNNEVITCVLTSSSTCASPASASSNSITITVGSAVTPSITVSAASDSVCSGTRVTFTTAITNGGTNPAYQWKVNGSDVNDNTNAYVATFTSNAIVTCVLTSNALCASPNPVNSNADTVTVLTNVIPTISINGNNTVCSGTSDVFAATITNGGTNPVYQWEVNGNATGVTRDSFTTSSLVNNDVITCILTRNAYCATQSSDTSNAITVSVSSSVNPTVTISASDSAVCTGQSVSFSANSTGQGSSPTYQWKLNGANVGGDSAFYQNDFTSNASVTLVLTSSLACANPQTVTAGNINVTVHQLPVVSITALADTICSNHGPITLAGSPTGGAFTGLAVYQGVLYPDSAGNNNVVITYQYTDSNQCSNTAYDTSFVEICLGLSEVTLDNIRIFPNPASSNISIFTNNNEALVASLTDMSGKMVIENKVINASVNSLDVSALSAGIYLLQVKDELGNNKVFKVVKQ